MLNLLKIKILISDYEVETAGGTSDQLRRQADFHSRQRLRDGAINLGVLGQRLEFAIVYIRNAGLRLQLDACNLGCL
jgi:hypothetical protein